MPITGIDSKDNGIIVKSPLTYSARAEWVPGYKCHGEVCTQERTLERAT